MRRKINTNPLLPFTYVDLMYIITAEKNKASAVACNNSGGRCNRRVNARCTLKSHSSVPAPDMGREQSVDIRELKALEIAARSKVIFADGVWLVPSQTTGAKYHVTLDPPTCNCEDAQLRGTIGPCKHVIAARLVCARDGGGKGPEIVVDKVPKRKTYKQDWPAYNKAQLTEKNRLQVLLHDLCRGIPEPARPAGKPGRTPTPLADQVFACAFKIYCTFSARRFNCDLQDARAKGYMTFPMAANKLCCFLESEELTPILHGLIVQSSLPLRAVETVFAPDSTGFSTSRFVRWYDEKYGSERSGREWVKAHAICGVKTNIVTSVIIEGKHAGDSPQFKPLVETTARNFNVKQVPADKGYLSRENLELVDGMGGTAFVPFKSNSLPGEVGSLWEKMFAFYTFRREDFLKCYHQRSNIESTFSMVKAKFRDNVRSKTDTAIKNEVLCKFLCHNICCLIQSHCELGIEPLFWQDEDEASGAPDVLPLIRPG
jgi:transposase